MENLYPSDIAMFMEYYTEKHKESLLSQIPTRYRKDAKHPTLQRLK